jgi:hypothetical protein
MERRIVRTGGGLGLGGPDLALLRLAFSAGMEARLVLDDHDPDFLHPARTALILMEDARVADPRVLAAGLVLETRDPALRTPSEVVQRLDAGVAAIVTAIPGPGAEPGDRLERLVALSEQAALAAVAERLDHARHLHLRPESEWWSYHDSMCRVYRPFAQRTHAVLAGRIEWWCTTFRQRFLAI